MTTGSFKNGDIFSVVGVLEIISISVTHMYLIKMPCFIRCLLRIYFRHIATLLVVHVHPHLSGTALVTSLARKCVRYMVDVHFDSLVEKYM